MMKRIRTNMNTGGKRGVGGFSLAELMIALGILAVGLSMAGALFPAAIKANQNSTRSVIGSIICENGLAVGKARYAEGSVGPPGGGSAGRKIHVLADDGTANQTFLSTDGRIYPLGDDGSPYGFALLQRTINDDEDNNTFEGWQMISVSYRRRLDISESNVVFKSLVGNINTDDPELITTVGGTPHLHLGTPVVNNANGSFSMATSASLSGEQAWMNKPLRLTPGQLADPPDTLYVTTLVEQDDLQQEHRFSPALTAMSTRFGLAEED